MTMHLVPLSAIAVVVAAVLDASPAHATSCGAIRDRYVFSCEAQRCVAGFRIGGTPAFGVCSRRPVVEDIDPHVAEFLAPLIDAPEDGIYTLGFWSSYWRHAPNDGSLTRLAAGIADGLLSSDERKRIDLLELAPGELRRRLDEHYGPSWISRDTTYGSLVEARRAAQDDARRALAVDVASRAVYWVSFGAVLLWFIHSVHTFFRRLYEPVRAAPRRLVPTLLGQLVIGVLGVVPIFVDRWQFWPGTLLIPGVVVILPAEGWAWFRSRKVV